MHVRLSVYLALLPERKALNQLRQFYIEEHTYIGKDHAQKEYIRCWKKKCLLVGHVDLEDQGNQLGLYHPL